MSNNLFADNFDNTLLYFRFGTPVTIFLSIVMFEMLNRVLLFSTKINTSFSENVLDTMYQIFVGKR